MIEYRKGNLLDVTSGVIIHGCNSHGVMGSGVALAVKNKYPGCFDIYAHLCAEFRDDPNFLGDGVIYKVNEQLDIVNMITQLDFGTHKRQVNYGAIAEGFAFVDRYFNFNRNVEFHFPKIGAGLGGGDWEVISEIIEHVCRDRKLICWEL